MFVSRRPRCDDAHRSCVLNSQRRATPGFRRFDTKRMESRRVFVAHSQRKCRVDNELFTGCAPIGSARTDFQHCNPRFRGDVIVFVDGVDFRRMTDSNGAHSSCAHRKDPIGASDLPSIRPSKTRRYKNHRDPDLSPEIRKFGVAGIHNIERTMVV